MKVQKPTGKILFKEDQQFRQAWLRAIIISGSLIPLMLVSVMLPQDKNITWQGDIPYHLADSRYFVDQHYSFLSCETGNGGHRRGDLLSLAALPEAVHSALGTDRHRYGKEISTSQVWLSYQQGFWKGAYNRW